MLRALLGQPRRGPEVPLVEHPHWVPSSVDLTRPSAARVYDYYLGGAHNFAVDRELAEQVIHVLPDLPRMTQGNRAFLRRSVRFLADRGIRQFLDIGSGIPTVGNVHETAQRAEPQARVVYVDSDPVAVAHSRALLGDDPRTAIVHADLRDPVRVLNDPVVTRLLDLDAPIGLLMVAVLHFVPEGDEAAAAIAAYREALAPGSHLVVSHVTDDAGLDPEGRIRTLYQRGSIPVVSRTRRQVNDFFAGFELVDPGVVYLSLWHPDSAEDVADPPERSGAYGAVGRRP
jgi:SAM-dependent methyltransferase